MKRFRVGGIALAAACLLMVAVGCGDSEETTPQQDAGTTQTDGGTTVPDGGGGDAGDTVDFVGLVEGFGMNGEHVADVTVEIFDNDTGTGTGVTGTTDADGKVIFAGLIRGKLYGFKSTLANYRDTFVWNIEAGEYAEETLWIVPNTVYQIALGLSGLTAVEGKSMVAGAVYWVNASNEEEAIGCAKVTTDPVTPDVRYMAKHNGLPTTLSSQACTASGDTEGKGRFVAANIDPGVATLTATDSEGNTIGSTTLFSIADSVAVSNIYATDDITANPTPATCSCTP